jgi:hypothetical protein
MAKAALHNHATLVCRRPGGAAARLAATDGLAMQPGQLGEKAAEAAPTKLMRVNLLRSARR